MNYRADIDGLRAIAVIGVILLGVIFFHAHFPLSGGFVGVDVFFVISGYLITKIIKREVEEGRFSFRFFWVRRIRRILPASVFVSLVVLLLGYFILDKKSLVSLGETAVG